MRSIGLFLLLLFPIYSQSQGSTYPDYPILFHPKSIMKLIEDEYSRLYTFPGELYKDGYELELYKYATCDPYPIINGDSLILLETIEREIPFISQNMIYRRFDHILTSIILDTGLFNFSFEIFQPELHFDHGYYIEYYIDRAWCKIRGVYEWEDKIVIVLLYDDFKNDKNVYAKTHVYVINNQGRFVGSYGYDACGIAPIGVDSKHDRLAFLEMYTCEGGSYSPIGTTTLWQIDLNTGEIVYKQETDLRSGLMNPNGYIIETVAPYNTDEKFTNIYSVVPFEKIATHPVYLDGDLSYWRDRVWVRKLNQQRNENGNRTYSFHAYNPETLEEVLFEETPYSFHTIVNDIPYLIERNLEIDDQSRCINSIRITKENANIDSWKQQ